MEVAAKEENTMKSGDSEVMWYLFPSHRIHTMDKQNPNITL
ncbi:hypothetical protein ADIS_4370 [Lunatimonas lonarensis]|uniref:Uncharacterized protein n=1 Tax=Lunatimonas lonarensis TaxID=1232681 RepID=R7ZMG4_9BACT|nr:hypothetical protein ADIS_4370 [Lunatimonas lonarensis]